MLKWLPIIVMFFMISSCGSTTETADPSMQLEAHERQKEKAQRAYQELDKEIKRLESP